MGSYKREYNMPKIYNHLTNKVHNYNNSTKVDTSYFSKPENIYRDKLNDPNFIKKAPIGLIKFLRKECKERKK